MPNDRARAGVDEVLAGLLDEFGEMYSHDAIRTVVEQARRQYEHSRIQMYVPIIAKRLARARLADADDRDADAFAASDTHDQGMTEEP